MTDSKLKRVASAIWSLQRDTDCNDYSQLTASTKALADDMARAAIEAMRLECDPFDPVLEAVQTEVDIWPEDKPRPSSNFVQFVSREEACAIWNAGIDAALKQEGGS